MSNENYELVLTATDRATPVVQKFTNSLERTLRPVRDLEAAMKRLGKVAGLTSLAPTLRHIKRGANDAAEGIRSIVPPLAAITGVGTLAGIAALVNGFAKMTVHSQNSAAVLGVSTSELLRWQGAARLAGASAESMQSSLQGIGSAFNAAATTDPTTGGVMRSIGVQVHRTDDGSVDVERGLLDLADVFHAHTNAQYRLQLADAFGISHDLIPLLAKGRQAVQDFYAQTAKLALSPEQQRAADNYNRSLVNLDFSVTNLKNNLGAKLAPSVQIVTDAVGKLVDKYGDVVATQVAEYTKRFADWLTSTDWAKVANDVKSFVREIGGVKTIVAAIALLTFAGPIAGVLSLAMAMGRLGLVAGGVLLTLGKIAASAAFGKLSVPTAAAPAAEAAAGAEAAEVAAGAAGGAILLGKNGLIARALVGAYTAGFDMLAAPAALMGYSPNLNSGEGDYLGQRRKVGEREKYLATKLGDAGYTKAQAAGIIGSLLQEDSTLDPQKVNPKSGATGIGQWLSQDRIQNFHNYTHTTLQNSTFEQQVDFMIHELATTESAADRRIRRADDPVTAARAHANGYERPAPEEANLPQRAANARNVYADLFGATPMDPKKADTLDDSQFQIVDTSQEGLDESQFQIVNIPADSSPPVKAPVDTTAAPTPQDGRSTLDDSQFQVVDTSQEQANVSPVQVSMADPKPQQINLHITGLPAGATVRAKSGTPGVTVAATVGKSTLGQDTL